MSSDPAESLKCDAKSCHPLECIQSFTRPLLRNDRQCDRLSVIFEISMDVFSCVILIDILGINYDSSKCFYTMEALQRCTCLACKHVRLLNAIMQTTVIVPTPYCITVLPPFFLFPLFFFLLFFFFKFCLMALEYYVAFKAIMTCAVL